VPSQVVGSVKSHISDLFNRVLSNQPQRPEARAVPGNNNAIVDLDAEAARAITTIFSLAPRAPSIQGPQERFTATQQGRQWRANRTIGGQDISDVVSGQLCRKEATPRRFTEFRTTSEGRTRAPSHRCLR
jgi:hypothetical protein